MSPSLPKVKDAVVRTPKGFRCRLSQRSRHAEMGHSMTSRLPKVKDAVVRTPQGLLPATASAVPVLERGKKTSLSRKGKLICRYFQPNIRTTSKLEAGRACRTSYTGPVHMTVPALLPATATAVPALERGKETSYCRPP